MPPAIGSKSPASGAKPPSAPKPKSTWNTLRNKANSTASILALFVFLLGGGGVFGYYYAQSKKPQPKPNTPTIENLSQDELSKLSNITSNLGSGGQVLNIGADALFRGKASVTGDLNVGGHLNANGPVTISQLSITGPTSLQNALTVNSLASFAKGISVTGTASVDSLNASSIAVRNIAISGPLTVGHLVTQGPAPAIVANSVGGGGTVSISGNDTSGQININTGTGPGTNVTLATITFRAAYGATVHVILSPVTSDAAAAQAYVTRSSTGFAVHANTPPAQKVLIYDYLVTQ